MCPTGCGLARPRHGVRAPRRRRRQQVWTAYWERSSGRRRPRGRARGARGGPELAGPRTAVTWGQARTPRVVVVDADGGLSWAGGASRRRRCPSVGPTSEGMTWWLRRLPRLTSSGPSGTAACSPTRRSTGWSTRTPGGGRRRADVGAGHGDPAARHETGRDRPLDRRDDRRGERLDLLRGDPADRGQALHRRRRRQDHPAVDPAGRGVRRGGAAAVRARARPHRRHPGQAGVDPGLAGGPDQRGVHRPAARGRRGDLRGRRRAGAGRPQAVRAA